MQLTEEKVLDFYDILPQFKNGLPIEHAFDHLHLEIGNEIVLPDGQKVYDVRGFKYDEKLLTPEWENSIEIQNLIIDKIVRNPDYLHFTTKYILNINLFPIQLAILNQLWYKLFPMLIMTRGGSKSYMLAIYIILRCLLQPGCKICVVGASLRQSMILFDYIKNIWENAPVLRDIVGKDNQPKRDQHICYWQCGPSRVVFLPLGDGEKIRGQRANVIIADEFSSLSREIFEVVVRCFASVKTAGMYENVVNAYKNKIAKYLGTNAAGKFEDSFNTQIPTILPSNQICLAGTASYTFNHFYKYYKRYTQIITGELKDPNINPKDYSVIRVPYDALPDDMMDKTILAQGKATMDNAIFGMEYGAVFPEDSEGFYLASVLQEATCPVKIQGKEIRFGPRLNGEKDNDIDYVMGIDPASEDDKFAINIIERHKDTGLRYIVYQWTTNRKEFENDKKNGLLATDISDYNSYIIHHIRLLTTRFNIALIVMDTGGGGVSVKEGLKDEKKYIPGAEFKILDIDEEKETPNGRLMLKMIEFSNYTWRMQSHHGLRKDFIDKKLLFPAYDLADAAIGEFIRDSLCDTLEDCYHEIEQCKQETTLIRHGQTDTGKEKWDVPKIMGVNSENIKQRLKKDRFSSLLLANWGCRLLDEDAVVNQSKNQYNELLINSVSIQGSAITPAVIMPNGGAIYIGSV